MPEQNSTNTKTEYVSRDEILSGVVSHGPIVSMTAKSAASLCEAINEIKLPHRIINIVFGEGRYHAFIEYDRKIKLKKEKI